MSVFIVNFEHNSYFFSSVSNVVCEYVFFRLNMTTIMVATTTIYVNITVIMTMTGTTTMIMTIIVTKTMIMTMVATTTMEKIFKQGQLDNFNCLLKMIKKATKIQFALVL